MSNLDDHREEIFFAIIDRLNDKNMQGQTTFWQTEAGLVEISWRHGWQAYWPMVRKWPE